MTSDGIWNGVQLIASSMVLLVGLLICAAPLVAFIIEPVTNLGELLAGALCFGWMLFPAAILVYLGAQGVRQAARALANP